MMFMAHIVATIIKSLVAAHHDDEEQSPFPRNDVSIAPAAECSPNI